MFCKNLLPHLVRSNEIGERAHVGPIACLSSDLVFIQKSDQDDRWRSPTKIAINVICCPFPILYLSNVLS